MPTTIRQMLNRFQALDIDALVQASIEETKNYIVVYNRENMQYGFKIDGTRIGLYSSLKYAALKVSSGSQAGFGYVNLLDTGDFQKGIFVTVSKGSISTDSSDEKSAKLEEEYGKGIFGLPLKYKPDYVKITQKYLLQKVKDQTVGG